LEQGVDDWLEVNSFGGELVFVSCPLAGFLVGHAFQQVGGGQALQSCCCGRFADADSVYEVLEAARSEEGLADEENRGSRADDLQGSVDRALTSDQVHCCLQAPEQGLVGGSLLG
jgi:hypothetical protein